MTATKTQRRKEVRVEKRQQAPTRGHVTMREHKDLSTIELNRRLHAKIAEVEVHSTEIDRMADELRTRRDDVKVLMEDIEALEALVEGRR